jgi:cell wall assembly regulator SMI1
MAVPSRATLRSAAMSEVSLAWSIIDRWIDRHAPASARARREGAAPEQVSAAEQALGLRFPADFIESLHARDGQQRYCTDLPSGPLLPLAGIVSTRQMLIEVAGPADDGDEGLGTGAGDDWWWHEEWLPIADLDGDIQFLDCRRGPGHGRVGYRPRDDCAHFGPGWGWANFATYLGTVATALTEGGEVDDMTPHLTADGELCWAIPGEDDELAPAPR